MPLERINWALWLRKVEQSIYEKLSIAIYQLHPLEEISFQGLGFHLVRHFADDLSYKRQNDMNILTIKKSFAALWKDYNLQKS